MHDEDGEIEKKYMWLILRDSDNTNRDINIDIDLINN